MIGLANMGSGDGSAAPGTRQAEAVAAPEITVAATTLFEDYQANEVSADSKYKGKTLAVTGTLDAIRKDMMDNTVLDLRTSNQFMPVRAELAKSQEESAGSLAKGNQVTVTCKAKGMIMGSPMLDECVLS
jgi:hypothetical protein